MGELNKIYLWGTYTAELLEIIAEHNDSVTCISFSSDSSKLFSGGRDCLVRVWDIESRACN